MTCHKFLHQPDVGGTRSNTGMDLLLDPADHTVDWAAGGKTTAANLSHPTGHLREADPLPF